MLERLQKIIARAGIASRRHAEDLIRSGQVRVNGVVVTELGAKADPENDRVEAAGRLAERPAEPGYFLLHKPIHVVSTMSDPEGRATIRHVLRGLSGGVFPVGGLDYAASGLMLLTSDGNLADRIFKNLARLPQVYWLKIAGRLTDDEMQQVGRRTHARLRRLRAPGAAGSHPANPWYEAELNDSGHDLLRRELFAIDHPVEKTKRIKLGPLELGGLPEGHYRQLAPSEVAHLRRTVEQASGAAPAGPTSSATFAAVQNREFAPAGRTKRIAPAWQPKRKAPAWRKKSGSPAGQTGTGENAWKTKNAARPWQNKSAAGAERTRGPSTPWQKKIAGGAGEKKSGGSPRQSKSGAPAWQNKSGAGGGQRKTGGSAWQPKGNARKTQRPGTRGPYGRGGEGHGGRDRHHGHDARKGFGKSPRHPTR